jgi:hypothetical protein
MLLHSASHLQVRWRSSTNAQGLPYSRLAILPSQNVSSASHALQGRPLVVGIGSVIAVGDHRDLTTGGALHIFGKLELAAIGQRKPGAKVSIISVERSRIT